MNTFLTNRTPFLMRVLIIDDEIIIGRTIEQAISENFECETLLALSFNEAKSTAAEFLPHLILCDINLNETRTGIDLINQLQQNFHFETIFITAHSSKNIIEKAVLTAPSNYILKPFDEKQLIAAVKLTQSRLSTQTQIGETKLNLKDILSKSEYKILQLISENKTSQEIADFLFISQSTVKNHRHSISKKLKLPADNNAVVKWAIENRGLLI
jgi:DNA-binding NarL/FixJ family response regulator